MKTVPNQLIQFLPSKKLDKLTLQYLNSIWSQILVPPFSMHTAPYLFEKSKELVLRIVAQDSTWSTEINFQKAEILSSIQKKINPLGIHVSKIQFFVNSDLLQKLLLEREQLHHPLTNEMTSTPQQTLYSSEPNPVSEEIQKLLLSIKDEKLQKALFTIASHIKE